VLVGTPAGAEGPPPPGHHLGHFAGTYCDLFCLRKATFLPFPLPLAFKNLRPGWRMDFFFTVASPRRTLKTLRAPRPLQAAPTTRQGPARSRRAAASHQLPAPAGAQHGSNQGLAPAQHLSSQGLDSLVL